ncbi:hypothetical protein [uncultured Methanobrevibacter sp.]|uniref:hypothetical protein n=1 Tax=uncultured Methanobrevibacter sp. TaxID=253161 RepID=UPI00261EE1A5|nr:hypothetical protein [uncultured Methanobrevibacter sp.]
MEDKNIIIVLLVIIAIILAFIVGYMFMPSLNAKKDCKITITSNSSLYDGDTITFKLTDMEGAGISNQNVSITLIGEDGTEDSYSIITDNNGGGGLKLNEITGNYVVNCTYAGNENFSANSTSQDLEIREKVSESEVQQPTQESSSQSNEIHYDEEINVYYDSNGIVVDPDGEHPMEVGKQYSDLVERQEKWKRGELEM